MSKKHKSRHRVPPQAYGLRSDPISPAYAAQVEHDTNAAMRRYRHGQAMLTQAEMELACTPKTNRHYPQLAKRVATLRQEVGRWEALLDVDSECSQHRMRGPWEQ
jgi:hypothetical protein